jgi:hypothetical protein
MSDMDQNSPVSTPNDRDKRAYRTPKLSRFGDVAELTRAIDHSGKTDGGANPTDKT